MQPFNSDHIDKPPYTYKDYFRYFIFVTISLLDILSFLVMAVGIVLCIRFFIFSPFTVVGQSMEPTFQTNNFVLIDKISSQKMKFMGTGSLLPGGSLSSTIGSIISQLPTITRGDIIVFVPPGKDIHYIKRVIGLPGETVHILENGVQICQTTDPKNCFILDEPYLPKEYRTLPACGISDFIVSDGFFVMGDNREHSTDSRCCFTIGCYSDSESTGGIKGYIAPYRYIIGKVWVRIVPTFTWY